VHFRHQYVQQNQIRLLLPCSDRQSLFTTRRHLRRERVFQRAGDNSDVDGSVVHNQDQFLGRRQSHVFTPVLGLNDQRSPQRTAARRQNHNCLRNRGG